MVLEDDDVLQLAAIADGLVGGFVEHLDELATALDNRDYSLIQATVLVVAIAFVVINLITDLLYMVINPKVAAEAKKGANNV